VRIENLKKGLHVLVACPGFTASNIRNSALNASGEKQGESPRDEDKMMSAEEVAEKILGAVVKRKRDLVLTTEGKLTVLLSKFFPSLLDRLVYNKMAGEKNSPLK
jgi:short-subunit dehydrogenase